MRQLSFTATIPLRINDIIHVIGTDYYYEVNNDGLKPVMLSEPFKDKNKDKIKSVYNINLKTSN